jgi:UPF0716 family protein affecting phage T7 exclusion
MKIHWLYFPSAKRKLWIVGVIFLLLTVIGEFFIKLHPYFEITGYFAFHAVFGFLSCVAMILFARLLGYFIKRRDDYYD